MPTRQALHQQKLRLKVLQKLGGKCKRCEEADWRILQIDHKNTNGKEDRQVRSTCTIHNLILTDPLYAKNFQLLCVKCHKLKRWTDDIRNNKRKPLVFKRQLEKVLQLLKPLISARNPQES